MRKGAGTGSSGAPPWSDDGILDALDTALAADAVGAVLAQSAPLLASVAGADTVGLFFTRDGEIAAEAWHPPLGEAGSALAERFHRAARQAAASAAGTSEAGDAPEGTGTRLYVQAPTEDTRVVLCANPARGNGADETRLNAVLRLLTAGVAAREIAARADSERERYERWFQTLDQQVRTLDRERQKFSAVVAQSDLYVFVIDESRFVQWTNKAFAAALPVPPERSSWIGLPCREVCTRLEMNGEGEDCDHCPLVRALASNQPAHHEFHAQVGETGRNVYLTALPIRTPDGRPSEVMAMLQDLTDLHVLRRSEARYRLLFERSANAILMVEPGSGRIVLANPMSSALLGYTNEELLQLPLRELHTPDEWLRVEGLYAIAHAERSHEPFECRLRRKEGPERVAVVQTSRFDLEGEDVVMLEFLDITERNRAEEALRASEARFRGLYSAVTDAVLVASIGDDGSLGRLTDVNEITCELLGYTRAELLGMRAEDIHLHDSEAEFRATIQRLMTEKHLTLEQVLLAKGGRRVPVEITANVFQSEGRPAIFALVRNITERKRAEGRLVSLAAAIEQSADDIILLDLDGHIQYVNSAFERTTGYAPAEAVGRDTNELLCRGLDQVLIPEVWDMVRSGRPWQGRFANRTKDGRVVLVDASLSAIRDAAGHIIGFVSARRDVTKQVDIEKRAAQTDKLEAIGTLAGGIAHDFNNILSAIIGYTQMAQVKSADPAIHRDLEAVLQGSMRATKLVKQILAFSRQAEREEKPVQVSLIVAEAMKFLRATVPTTIEIWTDVQSDAVVLADPTEIHRIIVNLCTNAALAMDDHGGFLEVGLAEVDLDASFAARHAGVVPGRFLRLKVRDTGCGMTREVMARVFEPFFTTREPGKGTGMGLAVVHGIVKRCSGAIVVESEPGAGTTFEVYLPIVQQDLPAPATEADDTPGGTERVLVVDDEPLVAETVADMLRTLGYDVRYRTNGLEALAAFAAHPETVDVVITDMTMPGMTGEVLAQRLKGIRPDLPVILCTGYSERMSPERAKALGIDEFVMKPVLLPDLASLMRKVLDRS